MNIYEYNQIRKDIKFVKVTDSKGDDTSYKVYFRGDCIGTVRSTTRTRSDIRNSRYSKEIKGVKEWGGHRNTDNRHVGYYHQSRDSATMALF